MSKINLPILKKRKVEMTKKELYTIFKFILIWQGQRISFLILFITSLVKVRTLNLSQIAEGFETKADINSNYRRIQRFLKDFKLEYKKIAVLISKFLPEDKWVLCMDRTDWKFGSTPINLLFLSVACKGLAIPIFVTVLTKKGNSNFDERKDIMLKFIDLFGLEKIEFLACDREFIGEKWFKWLIDIDITFHIRIRENFLIPNTKGKLKHVKDFFRIIEFTRVMTKTFCNVKLKLIGKRLIDGEYLIIATNSHNPTLNEYRKRWKIELMFSAFKTRGFNFEDTKITEPDKLEKLIALLSIAFCWCYAVGEVRNESEPIKFREDLKTLSKSIFHYGLEFTRNAFLNPIHKSESIKFIFNVLSSYLLGSRSFVVE